MTTLEDLDRRVAALEKAAQSEQTIVRAVAEIVAESDKRLGETEKRLVAEVKANEQRLTAVASGAEKRFTDLLNQRFDELMVAIDKKWNPPA